MITKLKANLEEEIGSQEKKTYPSRHVLTRKIPHSIVETSIYMCDQFAAYGGDSELAGRLRLRYRVCDDGIGSKL